MPRVQVAGGSTYLVKPRKLIAERVRGSPGNSFFLLELENLAPTDVYEDDPEDVDEDGDCRRARISKRGQEQLVEVSPGYYVEREVLDYGYLGHDEDGREIPLPRAARPIVRFLRGKVLFVAKGSLWNQEARTYDGRHSNMTSAQIRSMIEGWIALSRK